MLLLQQGQIHLTCPSFALQPPEMLPTNGLATANHGEQQRIPMGLPHTTPLPGLVQLNNLPLAGSGSGGGMFQFHTVLPQQPMLAGQGLSNGAINTALQIVQGQPLPQGIYLPQACATAGSGMVHVMTDGVPVASATQSTGNFVVGGLGLNACMTLNMTEGMNVGNNMLAMPADCQALRNNMIPVGMTQQSATGFN